MDERAYRDGVIPVLIGYDNRRFGNSAYAHNRRVRLIDDRKSKHGAKLAGIGDSKSGPFHIFGSKLLRTRALTEVADTPLQSEEIEIARVLEHRDNESPIEGNGNAHIDAAVITNSFSLHGGVNDGELLQGDKCGTNKKRHEGKAHAITLFERGFRFIPKLHDRRNIYFKHAMNVGAGASRFDHALRDNLAHLR